MIKISPYIPSYTTSYLCNVAYYDNRNGLASLKETRSYNLRSWLTNIDGQMFTEVLKYENSTIPQWGGNISVMQWGESAVQNAYSFIYDTHSRLQTANYSNASSVGLYSEIYNYDLNGNMLRHVRGSQPLVMNYSGNRLVSAGNAAFEYDAKGRQVMSAYGSGLSTLYNILDLPQRQTTGEGTVVDYKYAFDGRKLQEKVTAGASVTQRDYSGEFLYEGGVLKKILFDGGYVINGESGPVYMFFLRDHLGSVRAVVSETGVVQQRNNYFPYGDLFPNTSNDSSGNRYKYTGKESGDETDLYDFSARFLHTRFGHFTTIDPLAEKYPDISPYAYCSTNPVNRVDLDGRTDWDLVIAGILTSAAGVGSAVTGAGMTAATCGLTAGVGLFMVVDGMASIGIGVALMITGLTTEPSEKTDKLRENLPTDILSIFTKSADIILENENNEIENSVSSALFVTDLLRLKPQALNTTAEYLKYVGDRSSNAQYLWNVYDNLSEIENTNGENNNR